MAQLHVLARDFLVAGCRNLRTIVLVTAACGGGGSAGVDGHGSGSDGSSGQGACAATTMIPRLPTCSNPDAKGLTVKAGCTPTVDGTLHQEEWADATCFNIGTGGDVMYAKYSASAVYLAFSATPACGCGMAFAFDPGNGATLDGDEFVVDVFDDPFSANGDRGDFVVQGGAWTMGTAPAGIVTMCPGNQPSPINYEFKVPYSALGITAGTAHTFRFAVNHPNGGSWPTGVTFVSGQTLPDNPSNWGQLTSSSNWQ
jgi:hypothetical protein